MEKIDVKVATIKVILKEKGADVFLTFDKSFKGFAKIDGVYVECDVNYIKMPRYPLVNRLCALSDDIALFQSMCDHEFGQKELGGLLFKAELKIGRELKAAGEIVDDKPLERDSYITTIESLKLNETAVKLLDKFIAF